MQHALTLLLLAAGPLAAHTLPRRGSTKCKERDLVTVTKTVVLDPTTVLVAPTEAPIESQVTTDKLYPATTLPTTLIVSSVEGPSSKATEKAHQPETTKEPPAPAPTSTEEPKTTTKSDVKSDPKPSATSGDREGGRDAPNAPNEPLADATEVADSPAPTEMCGNHDRKIMPGKPWTVSNAMYNAGSMDGQQCTNYETLLETADGVQHVKYKSVTDIRRVDDTEDVCKGYSNVGIGTNLRKRFSDISSIPAYFQWDRDNASGFKGANVFDFITAPTSGDSESTASAEFMLWLQIWGGQVPIGYSRGPVSKFDLYGTTFSLYEGKNPSSGVTVRSALPDENFSFGGVFSGDIKDWLNEMASKGYIRDSDFVNVGNAGTEVFYGSSKMEAVISLEIKV